MALKFRGSQVLVPALLLVAFPVGLLSMMFVTERNPGWNGEVIIWIFMTLITIPVIAFILGGARSQRSRTTHEARKRRAIGWSSAGAGICLLLASFVVVLSEIDATAPSLGCVGAILLALAQVNLVASRTLVGPAQRGRSAAERRRPRSQERGIR